MNKKLVILHTSLVSHDQLNHLFQEIIPEVEVSNIVDDSLLSEVIKAGSMTDSVARRVQHYLQIAEDMGADLVFSQCSSMGQAIDLAVKSLSIPVLKIDEAMMESAIAMGKSIALVATVQSTLLPSSELLLSKAKELNKSIELDPILIDGALKDLIETGDKEQYHQTIIDQLKSIDGKYDVIVLAQGSMTNIISMLGDMTTPVLSSPELGVRKVRELLDL